MMKIAPAVMLIALAAVVSTAASAFVRPVDSSGGKESYLIPIGPLHLCMRQPDGVRRVFQHDFTDPEVLQGESPWVGETEGDRALIMTDPEHPGERLGFQFVKGRLRRMLKGDREMVVRDIGEPDQDPAGTRWPDLDDAKIADANERYGIHWRDRFSLWYKNPNSAGMLLVEFALLFFALLTRRGRIWKSVAIAGAAAGTFGVACTESRSAMLGLICGVACMAVVHIRKLFIRRNILLAAGATVLVAAAIWAGGFAERFTSKFLVEGYSEISRLPIWKEVPAMVAAAPGGWGLGQSGVAYMDWFQPLDRFHAVLGLISTHFTWLVEFGWTMRCVYMFAWFAGLCLLGLFAVRVGKVLPFAVWTSFFVASTFNTIGTEATLWIVPCALLAIPLASRIWRMRGICLASAAVGVVLTAIVSGVLLAAGAPGKDGVEICRQGRGVVVNGTSTTSWVVDDGFVLDGGYYGLLGKSMRDWYSRRDSSPAVGVVKSLSDVPQDAATVMVTGKRCKDLVDDASGFLSRHQKVRKVILLSPPFGWRTCDGVFPSGMDVSLVAGEFSDRVYGDGTKSPGKTRVVPGCGLYIPNWLRYLM